MPIKNEFDADEFQATVRRLSEGKDHGSYDPSPKFDEKQHAEKVADTVKGRDVNDFRTVLEYHKFIFYPPHRLPPWNNGVPRKIGEWHNYELKMAFTENDLMTYFQSSEDFHNWLDDNKMRARAKAAGLVLPR